MFDLVTMQLLWHAKWGLGRHWDESFPTDLLTQWLTLFNNLQLVEEIVISGHAFPNNYEAKQLHGFYDASEKAYGV